MANLVTAAEVMRVRARRGFAGSGFVGLGSHVEDREVSPVEVKLGWAAGATCGRVDSAARLGMA